MRQYPEASRRIIRMLQDLERDHGFRMFVVLERALISTTASDLASQLQQEWLPQGGGIVIVFESDTMNIGFGRQLSTTEGMETEHEGMPAFTLVEIISTALYDMGEEESPQVYIEKLVTEITAGTSEWFKLREAPVDSGQSLRLALVTIGSLSLLALCGMGIGWMMGKADKRQTSVRVFPETDVCERLGAPYGGGCVTTDDFSVAKKF